MIEEKRVGEKKQGKGRRRVGRDGGEGDIKLVMTPTFTLNNLLLSQ